MAKMRLDKLLAGQGTLSRREVKEMVRRGRVAVNGSVVKTADLQVDPEQDRVAVDGRELIVREHLYLMLHKPQGVVSATEDRRQPTVLDLVPEELDRLTRGWP